MAERSIISQLVCCKKFYCVGEKPVLFLFTSVCQPIDVSESRTD